MVTPLLTTKLYIPSIRPELVSRPRLIEQLNAGLWQNQEFRQNLDFGRKLTLISAPAGSGKTTLLSEWLADFSLGSVEKKEIQNPKPVQSEVEGSKIQNRKWPGDLGNVGPCQPVHRPSG